MNPLSPNLIWRMLRPGFLLVTVVACILGITLALVQQPDSSLLKAAAVLLLAVLTQAAANVLNDYYDALNGSDTYNQQGLYPLSGGSRLIQQGQVSIAQTKKLGFTLLGIVIVLGLVLALNSPKGVWGFGLVGLGLAWAYSAPPLALMTRGLGELAVALAWSLIVLGADYTLRGQLSLTTLWLALSYGLLVANVLVICAYPDAQADAKAGKATLVVRFGPALTAHLYLAISLIAYGSLGLGVAQHILPSNSLLGLSAAPLSLAAALLLRQHAHTPAKLRPAIVLTITAALLQGLSTALGLIVN